VFYYLGKEFRSANVGIIVATLLAFSPFHLFYSQEARAYTVVLLFITIAFIFYLKARKTSKLLNWALFSIFSALAFWTHFYGILVFLSLLLFSFIGWMLTKDRTFKELKPLIASVGLYIIITLPLILVTAALFLQRTSSPPTYGLQGIDMVTGTFEAISGLTGIWSLIFIALFVIGIITGYRADREKCFLLVFSMAFILGVSYILSYRMPFHPRFLIILLPFYFLGIGWSNEIFCTLTQRKHTIYAMIVIISLLNVPALVSYHSGFSKEDWRGFSSTMEQITKENDVVVCMPSYMSTPFDYYYNHERDRTVELGATSAGEIKAISDQYNESRIYVIITWDLMAMDPSGRSLTWLKENATFVGQYTGIYLFQIR
jgi:mannosyltransferase